MILKNLMLLLLLDLLCIDMSNGCNNGEGNGGEGCSPSDDGNNDED